MSTQSVLFQSISSNNPAKFYVLSASAHQNYPNTLFIKAQANQLNLGSHSTSNQRIIYQYIHENGIQSCQLAMGATIMQEGSVWNSVPPHTHTRRPEIYFYFDIPSKQRVFHFLGLP
ncbi:5-deoxy-glucuronate isomerase [Hydrotalea sp.]|uniref:5-deoxy-glucuronate isomerase n=1 Tax=Hydrotalea sp. TaxID=2881279 RepID=UPI0026358019|nr:5-deoxy-glucuronate isomerase [Hydrotalea sp.]